MHDTPAFFTHVDGHFIPSNLALSPWSKGALNGVAIGGLLAHLLDSALAESGMDPARLTIDILGTVPKAPLKAELTMTRGGARMRIYKAELIADGRVWARADMLCTRHDPTPPSEEKPMPFPHWREVPEGPFMHPKAFGGGITTRPIGDVRADGPGTLWATFDCQVVAGVALSPLVRAAIIGDFGNGVGSYLDRDKWTFANLDIALHFRRLPVGEWLLIHSETESAGNGHAMVCNTFADELGIYARGFATLFISPNKGPLPDVVMRRAD